MKKLRLVPVSGPAIEITSDKTLVGREPGCDVVLPDGSVSRKHAVIERRGEVWAVVDQASANGTFIDSQRVADAGLRSGQELRFGALSLRVEIEGEEEDFGATVSTAAVADATVLQPSLVEKPPPAPPKPPAAPPRPPAPPVPTPAPPAAGAPPEPPHPPAAPPPPPRPAPPRAAAPPPPPPPPKPDVMSTASILPQRISPIPPPRAEAPPPPRKGRGPFFWIATGCCGCLLIGVAALALVVGGAFYLTGDAVATVRAQIEEIKAGRIDEAYARLSGSYRAQVSRSSFEAFAARHPGLKENADSTFWSRSVKNDTAEISGALTAASGARETVAYKLVKEGGVWKITSIEVGGETPRAGPEAGDPGRAGAPAEARALAIQTTGVHKERTADGIKVTLKIRVTGFELRPEAGVFRIDLAQDLETLGPDGARIESLCRKDFKRLRETTATAQGIFANFEATLTFPAEAAGSYLCRLTIRDLVGGGQKTQEIPFQLP